MSNLKFEIQHQTNRYNRTGTLDIWNGKQIQTPIAWFGLSVIESPDIMHESFTKAKIEAFISNIFDLTYQDNKGKRKEIIQRLTKEGMLHKCDSGGFQMMKVLNSQMEKLKSSKSKQTTLDGKFDLANILRNHLNPIKTISEQLSLSTRAKIKDLSQKKVFTAQSSMIPIPDISVSLDLPLNPHLTEDEQIACIDWTVNNFKIALKLNKEKSISILPVIHGYHSKMLDYAIQKLEDVIGGPITAVGIGSLVPMVKSVPGSKFTGSKWNFLNLLLELREKLPDAFIHAFGVGGTMAYLAFLCGVDSIDSTGWIQKTAYGTIQMPGVPDRFLEKKEHNRPYLMENRKNRDGSFTDEIDLFMRCKCEACLPYYTNDWKNHKDLWYSKQNAFKTYAEESRKLRIIHNLSIFQSEVLEMRKAIGEDRLEAFVKDRLKKSIYKKKVEAIIEWQNGNNKIIKNQLIAKTRNRTLKECIKTA